MWLVLLLACASSDPTAFHAARTGPSVGDRWTEKAHAHAEMTVHTAKDGESKDLSTVDDDDRVTDVAITDVKDGEVTGGTLSFPTATSTYTRNGTSTPKTRLTQGKTYTFAVSGKDVEYRDADGKVPEKDEKNEVGATARVVSQSWRLARALGDKPLHVGDTVALLPDAFGLDVGKDSGATVTATLKELRTSPRVGVFEFAGDLVQEKGGVTTTTHVGGTVEVDEATGLVTKLDLTAPMTMKADGERGKVDGTGAMEMHQELDLHR